MKRRSGQNISAGISVVMVGFVVLASFGLAAHSNFVDSLLSLILGINSNYTGVEGTKDIQYLHPDMVRLDGFPWDIIEANRGAYDYTASDAAMTWARDSKQSVLGILQYAPGWANGQDFMTPADLRISHCGIPNLKKTTARFNQLRTYPPANPGDFGAYAYAIAKRYSDVSYWQIWNEPNNPIFWPTGPDARAYTRMLAASYSKIHKANPHAQVVLGGISLNDLDYVNALYKAGAKKYFDVMAVHLYNPAQAPDAYLAQELEKLHATMAAYGDGQTPIWLTEIGWYTGTAPGAVSEQQQAQYLQQLVAIARSKPYVGAVFWNTLMECGWGYNEANPEHNFGIFDNVSPKPAAQVMRGMMLNK